MCIRDRLVRGTGIHLVRESKLVDVTKPLERNRVDNPSLVIVERHEDVYSVAHLMNTCGHDIILPTSLRGRSIGSLHSNMCSLDKHAMRTTTISDIGREVLRF